MNRAEFLAYLTRLVQDGRLNEGDAADFLRSFDAGGINENDLPLLPADAITPITDSDVKAAANELRNLGAQI